MKQAPVNITPKNGGAFPWAGQDEAKFEQEWSMKPVKVEGYLDYDKQIQVTKWKNGEKGVEVVTPFYTHVDKKDKVCGIMVNRGWLPWDLKDFRYDRAASSIVTEGVLYAGDAKTKYSKTNSVINSEFTSVRPEELALLGNLSNPEASKFMLKAVDLDPEARTTMPSVDSKEELTTDLGIPAERHQAYEKLWNGVTYFGVVANTAMWLYL